MAPDERRAALVEACIPLLYERGFDVSTKQIAAAAGVAEGTIFGVFKDKDSLLVAALMKALDPQVTLDGLAAIDRSLPLRARMIVAAEVIQSRFAENAKLMQAARTMAITTGDVKENMRKMMHTRQQLEETLTAVIEPDADRLRRSPAATARLLLLFAGAQTYGPFGDPGNFNAPELVSLLLDGLLALEHRESGLVVPILASDGNGDN